jgi:signal transduction histidine kinase
LEIEPTDFPPVIPESEDPETVLSQFACEFKSPIHAIKGWATLILSGDMDNREAAKTIYDLAEHMRILQNMIVEYLRARGTLE